MVVFYFFVNYSLRMKNLVTKSELARLAGVSRQAAAKLTLPSSPLFDAVVGKKVRVDHPLVREWLASKGVVDLPVFKDGKAEICQPKRQPAKKNKKNAKNPKKYQPKLTNDKKETANNEGSSLPAEVKIQTQFGDYALKELEDFTVREVVMRYGSIDGFKRFVDALKNIAEYKYREIKIQQARGELVEREKVSGAVFALVDVAYARLVTDVPASLAQDVIARVAIGGENLSNDVQKMITDANSRILKNTKVQVLKMEMFKNESN